MKVKTTCESPPPLSLHREVNTDSDWLGGKRPKAASTPQSGVSRWSESPAISHEGNSAQTTCTVSSVSSRLVSSHLHCPLSVSQLTSGDTMPGREQLQTSQPTTGWQPNVWGSHWVHSGRSVLGGQIQSPVTGSHNLVPQLQAGAKRRWVTEEENFSSRINQQWCSFSCDHSPAQSKIQSCCWPEMNVLPQLSIYKSLKTLNYYYTHFKCKNYT